MADETTPLPGQLKFQAQEVFDAINKLVAVYGEAHNEVAWGQMVKNERTKALKGALTETSTTLNTCLIMLRTATNQLLLPDTFEPGDKLSELCSHCHTRKLYAKKVCNPCFQYRRKWGFLPGPDTLRNRDHYDKNEKP